MKKVCLTVAGVDPSGGAGIIADIKTFRAFDCFATAVITSITFQNTQGVFGAVHQSAETVRRQILPILEDFSVTALKTGMLPSREIIDELSFIIRERRLQNLVVDPVVRSTSGYDLIDDKSLRTLIEKLFPLAKLVTPNIPEVERICKIEISSLADIEKAAKKILGLGPQAVLIKGGHMPLEKVDSGEIIYTDVETELANKKAYDFLFTNNGMFVFAAPYLETKATHGTGCVLSAAITALLAKEESLKQSVLKAKRFVTKGIKDSPLIGKGYPPVNV